jgi:hypothetical protein
VRALRRRQTPPNKHTPTRNNTTQKKPTQKNIKVEIDKPTGLRLEQGTAAGGGLVVKSVSGNAAKSGIKPGDTVVYASSFFGDELWPADKLAFTNNAINAAPSPVVFVYVKGANEKVNVKRLPKKPAPPRFGRKLTSKQLELATHICVDCGYVYCETCAWLLACRVLRVTGCFVLLRCVCSARGVLFPLSLSI